MATKTIQREHPALFLGELRDDLERINVVDGRGKKVPFKIKGSDDLIIETLVEYPNDVEVNLEEE